MNNYFSLIIFVGEPTRIPIFAWNSKKFQVICYA